jgi:hypothetical protein
LSDGSILLHVAGSSLYTPLDQSSGPTVGKKFKFFATGFAHVYFLTTDNILACITGSNHGECGTVPGNTYMVT